MTGPYNDNLHKEAFGKLFGYSGGLGQASTEVEKLLGKNFEMKN